ncbi:MAG: SpoIIE family protein phosphatase [Acidimicrobiia bacterium]
MSAGFEVELGHFDGVGGVRAARSHVGERTRALGWPGLVDDAQLVVSELVTNALLHGGGCTGVAVTEVGEGVRISVGDRSRSLPLIGHASEQTMTGRGMAVIGRFASNWGASPQPDGKVVWADVTGRGLGDAVAADDPLAMWDGDEPASTPRFRVELGDVPTDFLLAAKAHVDNLVREFALMEAGESSGSGRTVPPHLASLLSVVTEQFVDARLSIKEQALRAAHEGKPVTRLVLDLGEEAAESGLAYLRALDDLDDYCRATRLFTLATEPEHRVFRHWYVGEIVVRIRAETEGVELPASQSFGRRVVEELRRVAQTERVFDRSVRLSRLTEALTVAATPEEVADAVLKEGVAALRADAGGLLLARDGDPQLALSGALGYDERVLGRLRNERRTAELPAAMALRMGESVWLESQAEREDRFPEMVALEPDMEALCAVPLRVGDQRLGALRFSFRRPRLFDDEERQFVLALANQTAQALQRAQAQHDRIDISRRLQTSLLPPELPRIPGVDIAAVYHPFGAGVEVGGDFYDAWSLQDGRWALAVGDASGTGPEAAALTARARYSLRALALTDRDPVSILRKLNALLLSAGPNEERFCTVLFGFVTVTDAVTVDLAGGGHPRPVVRRADGRIESVEVGGSLVGLLPDAPVDDRRLTLEPGDALVLVTDGVLEGRAPDGRFFDEAGLHGALDVPFPSARDGAERIEDAVLEHCAGAPQDDMAIVTLLVDPPARPARRRAGTQRSR